MNKKIVIVSIIIAILIVGAITLSSYAYFSIANGTGEESVITSGNMALRLTDGAIVTTSNILPGDYIEKEFSVENTGNVATSYDIYLSEVINNFADKTDFVYEITSIDGGYNTPSQVQLPNISTKIVNNQSIGVGDTHHYKLKITFLAKNENQDDNQGKVFSAKIQVNEYHDIETTVNYYLDNVLVNTMPTKESSNYLNSSCDKNGTITFNTNTWTYTTNIVQNNTICNIYFETIEITINYDGIDGTPTKNTDIIKINSSITELPTSNKDGYAFDGWFTDEVGGTQITNSTVFNSSQTVYAHYHIPKLSIDLWQRPNVSNESTTIVRINNNDYSSIDGYTNDSLANYWYRKNYEINVYAGTNVIMISNYGSSTRWYNRSGDESSLFYTGSRVVATMPEHDSSLYIVPDVGGHDNRKRLVLTNMYNLRHE